MALIDIALSVKNGGPFLREAFDSLASQTLRDFRVLICDDGSTDDTAAIIRDETRFPLVVLKHETSRGLAQSLNELLELPSTSTYIARFDADDVCLPERFARQVAFLEQHPEIHVVGSSLEIIDADGATLGLQSYPADPDGIRCELLFNSPLGNPSVLARATVLRGVRPCYDLAWRHTEDYDLWCRLSATTRMANLPEPLVRYRRHGAAVGVARQSTQLAEMNALRLRYLGQLALSRGSRSLLSGLLQLQPLQTPVTLGAVRKLLAEFDLIFARNGSAHVSKRRDELALRLLAQLPRVTRLAFLFLDPATRQAYWHAKFAPRKAARRRQLDQAARHRLARSIEREISARGGEIEGELRIYGDAAEGDRIQLGEQAVIEHGCSLWLSPAEYGARGRLVTGKNLFIGFNSRINIFADVTIGDRVLIGANCYLASNNHNYSQVHLPIQAQGFKGAAISIGDDAWLGCNVVVLPGVAIGAGAVIGAGSVVTRSVPAMEIWAGVPARKVKSR